MKKRIVSLLLALVLAASLLPVQAWGATLVDSGECGADGSNVTWTLDSEGTLTISGTGEMADFSDSVPWYSQRYDIKTVQILDGVTTIANYAFSGCSSLTSVNIPNSVTTIGYWAFDGCSSLTSVNIPNSVTTIREYAFGFCSSLTSVNIPDSVTYIEAYAFYSCSSLQRFSVDDQNPSYCSVDDVLFNKAMTTLIQYPAGKPDSNYSIPDSVTAIGASAFGFCSSLTSVSIPDGVTHIGSNAFSHCSSLTGVRIPSSVTYIGNYAFYGCSSLTSVNIPNSVIFIGEETFYGCSSLQRFSVDDQNPSYCSVDDVLFNKAMTTLIQYPAEKPDSNYSIPDSVTAIGASAFGFCSSLTSVNIPDSVTTIGDSAFESCSRLTSVSIPDSVTTIGWDAFASCSRLTSVNIPNSVTSIGTRAFFGCSSLRSVNIPNSVTTIGAWAFYYCSSLTSVNISNSVAKIEYGAFSCSSLTDVYYSGSEEQWKAISIGTYNDCLLNARIHYNWGTAIFHINSITPNHKAVGINEKFTIEFNKNVELGTGNIHVNSQDGKTDSITQEYYIIPVSLLEVSGNLVTVDISVLNLPEGSYYVTIPAGAFVSCDGDKFFGMKNKIDWEFAVDYDYDTEVPLKYAQKGHLFWKTDDKTKPGIPNGSDSDYAAVLYKWAKANGIDNLTEQQALKMLDEPMYLPATDMNGSTVLLNDKATTVRQALADILFFENLKPFAVNLDNDLSKIERFNQTGELKINALHQETDLYENVLGWYSQINSYLDSRNSKSNIFYSAIAPVAYNGLIMATDSAGIPGYSFVKSFIEADIQTSMLSKSLQGLEQYSNYTDFKNASKDVGTILKSGKAIYKAVAGEGSAKSFINLGANMLQTYFADSGNSTLNEISKSWSTADSVISATQLCISLGSSIGYFPLVVDLYNKSFERISNTVGACYFIGDYYVYDKYPAIYDSIYDDNTCMPEFDLMKYMDFAQAVENDPILYNWFEFLGKVTEGAMRDECRQLRYDLVNYILLLQYAREYDSDNAKSALVKYLSAECNKGKTTQFYTSCPVKVEVYDKNTNELVASLSSIDESIEENPYCSMYLMGENNETKCFVLSSDEYYAKIIPYDDGTMDISIISEDENGEASGKTFSNVQLTENKEFTLDLNDMNSGLETEDGSTIDKESTVPVSTVEISGVSEIAVGDSIQLTANAQPVIASDRNITWSSSDESVATVSNTGVVKAVSQGEAVIYAEASNGVKGEFAVSVFVKATELSLSIKNLSMVTGESYTLSAAISESATHEVSWKSENISKVAVDSSGNIYAKAAGSSLVTATIDGIEADVFVSVSDYPLDTVLYQLDGDGNALKLELSNNSCIEDLDEQGYIALYESGKLVEVFDVDINLAAGEKLTKIVLIPDFKEEKTYSAVFVPMGEKLLNQPSSELVFINGDSASEGTTEAATNELSGCQLASVTVSETTVGNMYTLFVINDESRNPSSENISYIERKQASEGQLEFLFGLDHLPNDGTYHAYLQLPDGTTTEMEIVRPNANQHIYTSAVTASTCTAQGYTTYTCACGDSYIDSYVDALGHDFGEWTVTTAPTCTEKGVETRYCSRCDATETRDVDALGHALVHHDGKAAACTEKGWEAYDTCSRCDYTTYKEIPATGHSYTSVVTEPTCTEQGYTTHTCACGDSYVADYKDALGHSFGEWTVTTAPTCTAKGTETRTCTRCNAFEIRDVAPIGHQYTAAVTAPTCTAQGYTTHTCTCGDSYVDSYTNALGHSYKNGVCTRCGAKNPNYVAAPVLKITTSAGKPKLTWNKVDGATKYYIYRSTDGKNYKQYTSTTKTSYTNTSTTIGTTYYYKVKAAKVVNGKNVYSVYSNVKSVKCVPAAPVVSISRSNGKPKLTWKAVTGASKYYIYRSTDGKTYKQYTSTTKTSYTNTGAASGKKYYYKVKAVVVVNKKNVFSAYSAAKNMMTTIATPSVSITTANGKPKLTWKAVTGADKYYVYRSTDGKTYKQLSTTTKTSLTNTGAKKNTKYYYKVKAVCTTNTNANSALSKAVSIKATK